MKTINLSEDQINELLSSYALIDQNKLEEDIVEIFLLHLFNNNQIFQALSFAQHYRKYKALHYIKFYPMVFDYCLRLYGRKMRNVDAELERLKALDSIKENFFLAINNDAVSAFELAQLFSTKNDQIELFFLKLSADKSHPLAAYQMGVYYHWGKKLNKNERKAFEYTLMSALKSFPMAMNDVGDFYLNGKGTNVDYRKAYTFLKRAYDEGITISTSDIAYLMFNGYGVEKDEDAAIEMWRKYAKENDIHCINYLKQYGLSQESS